MANAVLDGTDAVMLSAETARGKYPVESVSMMAKIINEVEQMESPAHADRTQESGPLSFPEAVCDAAYHVSRSIKARAIVAFTQSGFNCTLDLQVPASD